MKTHYKLIKHIVSLIIILTLITGCGLVKTTTEEKKESLNTSESSMTERIAGNKRFIADQASEKGEIKEILADLSNNGQHPFATVITCSDSRVVPEILFDQGLGKIFVIRVAGNVTDPVIVGSIEYAAEHLHTPLIVVLGHEKCGAVKASVEGGEMSPNLASIITKIDPSVKSVFEENKELSSEAATVLIEDKNVLNTVKELMESPVLKHLVDTGELEIIPAKYDLDTGVVEFLK